VGFFAKQMVLSAALDKGYIFLSLIAILTSVIGGVYYLNIIKEIFFFSASPNYEINPILKDINFNGNIYNKNNILSSREGAVYSSSVKFNYKNITISSPIAITISIITLIILLFIFMNKE
jgi:NADH-ubiquinone oxidoreductase chain 2